MDTPEPTQTPAPKEWPKATWAEPLARFHKWWTRTEARLCAAVLLVETLFLCLWIAFKGLSAESALGRATGAAAEGSTGDKSGLVLRGILGAAVLASLVHLLLKPRPTDGAPWTKKYKMAVTGAVLAGMVSSVLWADVGTHYFSNWLNWIQMASTMTLVGGLRGFVTRLTLWVALLGASLATAQGKHINIDIVMRSLGPRMRVPVAVLGWVFAATVCLAGAIGFADYIAMSNYNLKGVPCPQNKETTCDPPVGDRARQVLHETRKDLFLLGRQVSLDLKTAPKVLSGAKYNEYLRAGEWNAWLDSGNWTQYFTREELGPLRMSEADPRGTRYPILAVPDGEVAERLAKELNFIFPFGLLMIALRFLLRALLALLGHVRVDPDAVHAEDEILHHADPAVDPRPDESHSVGSDPRGAT